MTLRADFDTAIAAGRSVVSCWVSGELISVEVLPAPAPTDTFADVSFGKSGWLRLRESVRVLLARYTADHGVPRSAVLVAAREARPGVGDAEAVAAFLGVGA